MAQMQLIPKLSRVTGQFDKKLIVVITHKFHLRQFGHDATSEVVWIYPIIKPV